MYLTVTDSNQKSGILTTEDLLNISNNYTNSSGRCILWYTVILYLLIISIFFILYMIDKYNNTTISDKFSRFHGSLPGYAIVISILAIIPTIIRYMVDNKVRKAWRKKYVHMEDIKSLPCF